MRFFALFGLMPNLAFHAGEPNFGSFPDDFFCRAMRLIIPRKLLTWPIGAIRELAWAAHQIPKIRRTIWSTKTQTS